MNPIMIPKYSPCDSPPPRLVTGGGGGGGWILGVSRPGGELYVARPHSNYCESPSVHAPPTTTVIKSELGAFLHSAGCSIFNKLYFCSPQTEGQNRYRDGALLLGLGISIQPSGWYFTNTAYGGETVRFENIAATTSQTKYTLVNKFQSCVM